jgi:glycosyltransferase involved in cell wall biosynthesis
MTSISVVIPLYNHALYIEDAIRSILRQTSPADEIIVLDDGSQDTSADRAILALQDQRDAIVIKQKNQGAHATINRLVELSSCDYVAILNSDDLFLETKLERCRRLLEDVPDADLIVGEAGIVNQLGNRQSEGVAADWMRRALAFRDRTHLTQLSLIHENWVATTSNMVFTKRLWRNSGGFVNLRYCHDLDFLMFALRKTKVLIDIGHEHILYRVHPANTIGEGLRKIRLELAAVVAVAIRDAGSALLEDSFSPGVIDAFFEMIEAKNLRTLTILLQLWYSKFETRREFYEFITDHNQCAFLENYIR